MTGVPIRIEIKALTLPCQFILPNGHVLFKIEEATLAHETFTGRMTPDIDKFSGAMIAYTAMLS